MGSELLSSCSLPECPGPVALPLCTWETRGPCCMVSSTSDSLDMCRQPCVPWGRLQNVSSELCDICWMYDLTSLLRVLSYEGQVGNGDLPQLQRWQVGVGCVTKYTVGLDLRMAFSLKLRRMTILKESFCRQTKCLFCKGPCSTPIGRAEVVRPALSGLSVCHGDSWGTGQGKGSQLDGGCCKRTLTLEDVWELGEAT